MCGVIMLHDYESEYDVDDPSIPDETSQINYDRFSSPNTSNEIFSCGTIYYNEDSNDDIANIKINDEPPTRTPQRILQNEERVFIIRSYYKTNSYQKTVKAYIKKFKDRVPPTRSAIFKIVKKFEKTASARAGSSSGRPKNTRTNQKIHEIQRLIENDSSLSIRRIADIVDLKYSTTRKILREDLKLYPYKIHIAQDLKSTDHELRMSFCSRMLKRVEEETIELLDNIYFSDESWFELTG